jgi:histidine ammonia-lyase
MFYKKVFWKTYKKNYTFFLYVFIVVFPISANATEIILDGNSLTLEQIFNVSMNPENKITITSETMKKVEKGFHIVLEAALQNKPVYGLTVGVGWNKDKPIFHEVNGKKIISEDLLSQSKSFNLSSLRAHAAGVGEPLPINVVRAGMLIRLNTMLNGESGANPEVIKHYISFLNQNITPVVPSEGTVGEADITMASHIGLAMAGEWKVFYKGKIVYASEALKTEKIAPLQPVGKDFLSIISTNAITAGNAVLGLQDIYQYLNKEIVIFALQLEGLNGNIAPFLKATTQNRPYPGMLEASKQIRSALDGSSLWQTSNTRALQDPLSYRTMAYTLGNLIDALENAKRNLDIQINHSDDNPMISFVEKSDQLGSSQVESYFLKNEVIGGAIYPTANFESLPMVSSIEAVSLALAKVSQSITMATIRMENPEITKLPRFLSDPGNQGHAFGAIQKPFVALNNENMSLGLPVSLNGFALAGNIEDTFTNSSFAVKRMREITNNLYKISSFQLLHAAQAVDLRKNIILGKKTKDLYEDYRKIVPYVAVDRIFTYDIEKGIHFLMNSSFS